MTNEHEQTGLEELEARAPAGKPRPNGKADKPTPAPRALAWTWADDVELDLEGVDTVAGLIPRTGLTVAYGPSGCGKTFFAVDLACHVAAGLPWFAREVAAGVVLYIAAEAPASVERRVTAWKWRHNADPLDLAIIRSSVDLLAGDAAAIIALARQIEAERGPVVLVVIDTLARAMVGNENAPEDMGRFVAGCTAIRDQLGAHVLVVHHCGKDEARGARGHSSLRAATDVEIELAAADDGTRTAKVTKHRDEAGGAVFAFLLDVVELGTNGAGRIVTTAVAVETEAGAIERKAMGVRLTSSGRIAVDALEKAVRDFGEPPPETADTAGATLAVSLEQWRACFRLAGGYTEDDAKGSTFRSAFQRGKESAIAAGRAKTWGGYAWLPKS